MKDGLIVQIGTPEDIVTNPADDYVKDCVEGISKLNLVYAHSIMEDIPAYVARNGGHLSQSPRVAHDKDLNHLIDVSTTTEHPIVVQGDDGKDVGVISKSRLLKGIQGGSEMAESGFDAGPKTLGNATSVFLAVSLNDRHLS